IRSVLESMAFKQSYSDASIYIYSKDGVSVILPVFVDDMTFVSRCKDSIESLVHQLGQHFKIRDLGPTSSLLGIKIDRDWSKHSISLSQRQTAWIYLTDLVWLTASLSLPLWCQISTYLTPNALKLPRKLSKCAPFLILLQWVL